MSLINADIQNTVSVIITCYNEEKFIAETIQSVLSQTRIDLIKEIIVVDDGSKDASKDKILNKASENPLIKYVCQENKGLPSARNTGINLATGNFIGFLDGDDIWLPAKIERQMEHYKKNFSAGLIYSDFYKVNSDNIATRKRIKANSYNVGNKKTLSQFFVHDGPIVPSSVLIKREVFETVSVFDPSFIIAEDTEMWLRIAAKFHFHHVAEPLVLKRQVVNSLGSNAETRIDYFNKINEKITGLYPDLKPLLNKRNARRITKLALYYNKTGNKQAARANYSQAMRLDRLFWKPYFYYFISILPTNTETYLIDFFKRLRVAFK